MGAGHPHDGWRWLQSTRKTKSSSASTTVLRTISLLPPAIWQSATNAICHISRTWREAALKVFDSLKKYHGLGARERLLLQIAANLHSCGKFVTMRGSEECGYNMIMATEIIGLSHVEREIVANIVKYHQQKFRYNEVEVSAKAIQRQPSGINRGSVHCHCKADGHSAAGQFHGPGPYRKIKRQPPECEGRTAGNPDGLRGRCDAGVHIHCG